MVPIRIHVFTRPETAAKAFFFVINPKTMYPKGAKKKIKNKNQFEPVLAHFVLIKSAQTKIEATPIPRKIRKICSRVIILN